MIVSYTPEDGEQAGQELHYDASRLRCGEVEAVEGATALQWVEISQALRNQSPRAMRAVVWALRKRAEPTLRYSHFDPMAAELKALFSTVEIPDFWAMVQRSMNAAEQAQVEQEIVAFAVDPAAARAVLAELKDPKAPEAEAPATLAAAPDSSEIAA